MAERSYSFDEFTVDLARACLLRQGREVRLRPKSYEAFKYLIENRGRLITKEELIRVLWPDSFVTDDSLVKCLKDVRLALGDDGHRYIKTVPRRGYIFDAEVVDREPRGVTVPEAGPESRADPAPASADHRGPVSGRQGWQRGAAILVIALAGAAYLAFAIPRRAATVHEAPMQLVRLTFDPGLESEPTWSPDATFLAYSSDRNGNFDIWVKPVSGGDAVQLTTSPEHDSQPDWSPHGGQIAFRSEREGGGIYVMPALGGPERKVSTFGFRPRWSPDGSQVLFMSSAVHSTIIVPRLYVAALDGRPPQEILADTVAGFRSVRAAWHPDGRISLWGDHFRDGQSFWTMSTRGGPALRSDVIASVDAQLRSDAAPQLLDFFWAPAGDAIYFEGWSRGVKNLWRVRVDPRTLRWAAGPERLTIGPGPDLAATISRDGRKLAYSARRESTRVWVFPFDETAGAAEEKGQPLTPDELHVIDGELSPDGRRFVFAAERAGQPELWGKSLEDGSEKLLAGDNFGRGLPRWSRDSSRFAYIRTRRGTADGKGFEHSLALRTVDGNEETVLTSPRASLELPSDWSADGASVLASTNRGTAGRYRICWFPLSASPRAETDMRVVVSDPQHDLWHGRLSADGRWVSFHAVDVKKQGMAAIYVTRLEGGDWVPLAPGESWNGKARWSADGRALYFISNRTGLFEMWGVRFDTIRGKPLGQPFRVWQREGHSRRISLAGSPPSGLSLAAGRLALPLADVSGSVWMLEGIAPWHVDSDDLRP